ncbi:hypothetical protein F4561_003065 [Lipingzhangella halophila]|uniref:Uncharacterized protein n=1 Tax=Lipingzhangella halophila TaxID=1783352 RepID=A0A7W7RHU9_9ACTN|nr:hypothetical protein [Lipingzhangella halophila]MBB4932245.1 hypothetical protein [Lipingzhangella halophila]
MSAPREFHAPCLGRDREMYELLRAGRVDEAAGRLAAYLDTAERQLVEAFTGAGEGGWAFWLRGRDGVHTHPG